MQLQLRCVRATMVPNDTSGFLVDLEIADWTDLVLALDEDTLRFLMGPEHFQETAEKAATIIRRALDKARGNGMVE